MRLLTYNIHKGIGGRDRRYRLERIVEVIEAENPDLVCLQEVTRDAPRSRFDDQPGQISEYFASGHVLFQKNVVYKRGGYGNLLLSRWPLLEWHQVSLRLNSKKPRGAQVATIETPEGAMQLVNWHLGLSERERHWQAERLLGHRLFCKSAELPTLIAGDYNDWRDTLARGPLAAHGFRQITHPLSRFRTFPAWLPVGALDKAFFRGAVEIKTARIVRSLTAKRASDHLPVVIDFHLNGNGEK